MQEVVKNDIETFLKNSLFCTIAPVLSTTFVLTYILNLNIYMSITMSMVLVYLIDTNICKNYCYNKNKLLGFINLLIIIMLLTIGLKIYLNISLFKILSTVCLIVIEPQILCKVVLIKNQKKTLDKFYKVFF